MGRRPSPGQDAAKGRRLKSAGDFPRRLALQRHDEVPEGQCTRAQRLLGIDSQAPGQICQSEEKITLWVPRMSSDGPDQAFRGSAWDDETKDLRIIHR